DHRQPQPVLDAVVEPHRRQPRLYDARIVAARDDAVAVPLADPPGKRRAEFPLLEEDRPRPVLAQPPRDAAQEPPPVFERRLDDQRDVGPGAPSGGHVKKREDSAPVSEFYPAAMSKNDSF